MSIGQNLLGAEQSGSTEKNPYVNLLANCNLNMVESNKKRDQIITFYIALVGAYLAFNNSDGGIQYLFIGALVVLGLILSMIIVQYRKWHIRYINSSKVLVQLILNPTQNIMPIIAQIYADTRIDGISIISVIKFTKRYLQGIEFLTFMAFLIILFVPIQIILGALNIGIVINASIEVVYVLNLLYFLVAINILAIFYLAHDFSIETPFATWILPNEIVNLIKSSNMAKGRIKSSRKMKVSVKKTIKIVHDKK